MPAPADAPWLSVLVPAHNAVAYIDACLQSVLDQGVDGVELVVLDDASTDATWTALQSIGQAHPRRVRLLRAAHNRGLSATRNALLENANGTYVWFVDADDLVEAGAIAQLRTIVEASAPDLVLCDFRYLQDGRTSRRRCTFDGPSGRLSLDRSQLAAGLLQAGELHAWSKIGKRELWRQAPFPEGRHFEDIAVTLPLLRETRSFVHVRRAWIRYRRHSASIMATMTPLKVVQWMASVEELRHGLLQDAGALQPAALRALDDFSLGNFVSALRRVERMPAQERSLLHDALRVAHARLFPQGSGAVLRDWRRRGWWLRALRAQRALRNAKLA